MRSWKWMLAATALAVLLPSQGTDVGKLKPAELLYAQKEGAEYIIQTDTGDEGRGDSVESALMDLKETADGAVFLETVEYLLLTEETRDAMRDFAQYLRPTVQPCVLYGEADLRSTAKYLSAHQPKSLLRKQTTAILTAERGRYHLNAESTG